VRFFPVDQFSALITFSHWPIYRSLHISALKPFYEMLKEFISENKQDLPWQQAKHTFETTIKHYFETSLKGIMKKAFAMLMLGVDEQKDQDINKHGVFIGLNHLKILLPEYVSKVEHARRIMWNYFNIYQTILEREIDQNFGTYYKKIFRQNMLGTNYLKTKCEFHFLLIFAAI
jgi:hypothetical protein